MIDKLYFINEYFKESFFFYNFVIWKDIGYLLLFLFYIEGVDKVIG